MALFSKEVPWRKQASSTSSHPTKADYYERVKMVQNYNSNRPNIMKAVVISNSTVLSEGTIKVALIHPLLSPLENTGIYNLHKSSQLYDHFEPDAGNPDMAQDKSQFRSNIVNCRLGTPYSGSTQNSGWLIVPPINSKGLVLRIIGGEGPEAEDYYWVCGIFDPSIKYRANGYTPSEVFTPFPSNLPEIMGTDFNAFTDAHLDNAFQSIDSGNLPETSSNFNGMVINPQTEYVDDKSKNAMILRIPLSMGVNSLNLGSFILNDGISTDGGKTIDATKLQDLKNEFNSILYPTHYIQEISDSRFHIHKAMDWKTYTFPVDPTKTTDLAETVWIDFTLGDRWKLDKYPTVLGPNFSYPANMMSGYGLTINDISVDQKGMRFLETKTASSMMIDIDKQELKANYNYIVETGSEEYLFFEGDKQHKIDYKLSNDDKNSSVIMTFTNKDKKKITLTIDLEKLNIDMEIIKDSSKTGQDSISINAAIDGDAKTNAINITSLNSNKKKYGIEIESETAKTITISNDEQKQSMLFDAVNMKTVITDDTAKQSVILDATSGSEKITITQGTTQEITMNKTPAEIDIINSSDQSIVLKTTGEIDITGGAVPMSIKTTAGDLNIVIDDIIAALEGLSSAMAGPYPLVAATTTAKTILSRTALPLILK